MTDHALLSSLRRAQRIGDWSAVTELIGQLRSPNSAADVTALLATLVDDVLHESTTFAVVHLAERATVDEYCGGFIAALPDLAVSSPRWARTLLARVSNSMPAAAAFVRRIASASADQRVAAAAVADDLVRWKPERFESFVTSVHQAIDEARS